MFLKTPGVIPMHSKVRNTYLRDECRYNPRFADKATKAQRG